MRRRPLTKLGRVVSGGVGLLALAVGVAGFLGWPRPYDPAVWFIPALFCGLGAVYLWEGAQPQPSRPREIVRWVLVAGALAALVAVAA